MIKGILFRKDTHTNRIFFQYSGIGDLAKGNSNYYNLAMVSTTSSFDMEDFGRPADRASTAASSRDPNSRVSSRVELPDAHPGLETRSSGSSHPQESAGAAGIEPIISLGTVPMELSAQRSSLGNVPGEASSKRSSLSSVSSERSHNDRKLEFDRMSLGRMSNASSRSSLGDRSGAQRLEAFIYAIFSPG